MARPDDTASRVTRAAWADAFIRPALALLSIIAGFIVHDARAVVWMTALILVGGFTVAATVRDVLRGRFASDIVAALAVIGAVVFSEPLAGLIVVLMQTGGEALERWAEGRASAAVRSLEDSAPRIAHRMRNGNTDDVTVDQLEPADRCLVRPGEMVPADGVVDANDGELDLARITGEPIPIRVVAGDAVRSGAVVVAKPLVIRVTARADESLYARIVELVREAQAHKAPFQRLADKWAVWFTPFTLVACALTYLITRDTSRLLAVLVVATPCPLILAAPVAIIGGINRIARHRVIVRTGSALERLAHVNVIALDKTGTLTVGHPEVKDVQAADHLSADELLGMIAAVESVSGHPMARSVVRAALKRSVAIGEATNVVEESGRGVRGMVGQREIAIGSPRWIRESVPTAGAALDRLPPPTANDALAIITIDGAYAGTVTFEDALRPGLAEFFAGLTRLGIKRTVLLSGDRADRVAHVAKELGVTDARGDLLPDDKVKAIAALVYERHRVAMIGDGVNDAPALAAATVGIAVAAHGGGIAAQSADCVLLADDLRLVTGAIRTARRTLRIARESVYVGIGLSVVAMGFAAVGLLAPVPGALVQEAIDVAVILNAIRAAGE